MTTYRVSVNEWCERSLYIEADTPEEAMQAYRDGADDWSDSVYLSDVTGSAAVYDAENGHLLIPGEMSASEEPPLVALYIEGGLARDPDTVPGFGVPEVYVLDLDVEGADVDVLREVVERGVLVRARFASRGASLSDWAEESLRQIAADLLEMERGEA